MVASSPKLISDRALHDAELISNSGAWAKSTRQSASARAQEQGLPQRRDEYWKYTRPDLFVQKNVALIP